MKNYRVRNKDCFWKRYTNMILAVSAIIMLISFFLSMRYFIPLILDLKDYSDEDLYVMAEDAVNCIGAHKVEEAAAAVLHNAKVGYNDEHFPKKDSVLYVFKKKLPNAASYWFAETDGHERPAYLLLRFGTHERYRFLVFTQKKDSHALSKCKKLSGRIGFADNSIRVKSGKQ